MLGKVWDKSLVPLASLEGVGPIYKVNSSPCCMSMWEEVSLTRDPPSLTPASPWRAFHSLQNWVLSRVNMMVVWLWLRPVRFALYLFVHLPVHPVRLTLCACKREVASLQRDTPKHTHHYLPEPPGFRALCYPQGLPHPVLRRAPRVETVGLWNLGSCDPVWERG
jgi:hypothetical protein